MAGSRVPSGAGAAGAAVEGRKAVLVDEEMRRSWSVKFSWS